MSWSDFNSAEEQSEYDVIPKGTLVKVRMTIKPGGYDDPQQGWTGGYATRNDTKGSVYLNCEFVVLEGKYAKRKIWTLIGLYSPNGPEWANMGRSFVRGILNSARGIKGKDESPQAQEARRISGFADLDGIEFVAKLGITEDQNGDDKNEIRVAITPDHKEYANLMGQAVPAQSTTAPAPAAQNQAPAQQPQQDQAATPSNGKPSWAQ